MVPVEDSRLIHRILTVLAHEAVTRSKGQPINTASIALTALRAVVCFYQAHARRDAPEGACRDALVQYIGGMRDLHEGRRSARKIMDRVNADLGLEAERVTEVEH